MARVIAHSRPESSGTAWDVLALQKAPRAPEAALLHYEQWGQGPVKYLRETTQLAVGNFLVHLERFQAGREAIPSPSLDQEAGNEESGKIMIS